jgi:hypothetical protein
MADPKKLKSALDYALEIRKFETGLYWKRAACFWALMVLSFGAYIRVQRFPEVERIFLSLLVGSLGFIFSFACYCVNRASAQWRENWAARIREIEARIIPPLNESVLERPEVTEKWWTPYGFWIRLKSILIDPAQFSISRINQIVSLCVTVFWGLLVLHALPPFDLRASIDWGYTLVVVVAVLACLAIWFWGKSYGREGRQTRHTKGPELSKKEAR